ncbi:MAG: alpha/beta fold hydrolase [Propionibacteriales bacterium]|nr:alpha/beta fold hydrolase [Propionibacteriales bacterium]
MLLIMGLGGPSIWWDDELCTTLSEQGFYVIRYDNRDVGRSTYLHGARVTRGQLASAYLGNHRRPAPYTLSDMADDGLGLLDHLGIEAAHLWGVSMGGMIAQTMAIARPDRVRSLVSTMSTTGRRTVGWSDPRLLPLLIGRRLTSGDGYVRQSARVWRAIGSRAYPEPPEKTEQRARDTWDRGVSRVGSARQMMAILTQPDRTAGLHRLRVPTLVLHGMSDRLVHPSGGRATAAAVPGAELVLIRGMGHDLPQQLNPVFVDAVCRTAARAEKVRR